MLPSEESLMERAVFDRMAELDQAHWWFAARREILEGLIARLNLPERARILEIGCGTGHNLAMLSRFGRVDGCELDASARELASQRSGRKIFSAKLPDLSPFDDESYDLIALLDVLEHVEDDRSALEAIFARLRPGGALLLTVPANPWMWSAHDVAHHHYRRYSRSALARLFRHTPFEVQLFSYFNSILFPLIAAVRIAGKLTGKESTDDDMPGNLINSFLMWAFGLEAKLIGRVPMPFGVSLVAVLRRPHSSG
jgi:SAM-dependent methyltransferase